MTNPALPSNDHSNSLLNALRMKAANFDQFAICGEAADEIERLQRALHSIGEYDCISGDYRHCPGCPVCDANKAYPGVSVAHETPDDYALTLKSLQDNLTTVHGQRDRLQERCELLLRENAVYSERLQKFYHDPGCPSANDMPRGSWVCTCPSPTTPVIPEIVPRHELQSLIYFMEPFVQAHNWHNTERRDELKERICAALLDFIPADSPTTESAPHQKSSGERR